MEGFYDMYVPMAIKSLTALRGVLQKGQSYCAQKGIAESEILDARLAPDMYPLLRQVQIACDNAKGIPARLSGVQAPVHEDTEQTFDELVARIDKTIAFINTFKPEQFANAADAHITMRYMPEGKYMLGKDYAALYALPNFFFHVVTAYDILRNKGVELGKNDYIGGWPPLYDVQ